MLKRELLSVLRRVGVRNLELHNGLIPFWVASADHGLSGHESTNG